MEELPIILIVEDEELIRTIVNETLEDGGFRVVLVSSGEEAIKLLDAGASAFRALVTDVNLGHGQLSGWEVARCARESNSDLAIVYMTGDGAAEWSSQGVPNSILLNKPLAPAQLLTAVAQLLNIGGQGQFTKPSSPHS